MRNTLFACCLLLPLALQAQDLQVIATGGQQLSNGQFLLTATVGEPVTNSSTGELEYVSAGFQQGYRADEDLAADQADPAAKPVSSLLFPNPTTDRLQVSLKNAGVPPLRLQILNRQGGLVREAETSAETFQFDLHNLPAGHYWVVIQAADQRQTISLPFEKINP